MYLVLTDNVIVPERHIASIEYDAAKKSYRFHFLPHTVVLTPKDEKPCNFSYVDVPENMLPHSTARRIYNLK